MDERESSRLYEHNPTSPAGLSEIMETGIRAFRLGFGLLLCATGFFLGLQVFYTAYGYITEPETLEAVLAHWDRPHEDNASKPEQTASENPPAPAETAAPSEHAEQAPPTATVPPANPPQENPEWFVKLLNVFADEVAAGRLARPLGGLLLFLFMTILAQISLGLVRIGAGLLHPIKTRGTSL